ncbi:hypothetical protein TNCV_3877101 [Trichonephila clavipes]|uniref:Uncharacterized protein n=1 Tax=Trichonephila clavipes TaxID=2585209 RepID=A0A8X6SS74_TRICX|nr:hypothetical protein TNCV_3877101 [Trichonephila clavipes]
MQNVQKVGNLIVQDHCFTIRETTMLCVHAQSMYEICSKDPGGGIERTPSCSWHRTYCADVIISKLNMALYDSWLFTKMKIPLNGYCFQSNHEMMQNATAKLSTISEEAFQKCIRHLEECLARSGKA